MTRQRILGLILVVLAMFWVHSRTTNAQSSSSPALTGQVTSQEEGAMEGVLVSATRAGSTMTITVVTDAQGRYSFPQSRLEPGPYSIRIRAVGYDLETPGNAEVKAQASAALDLKLRKTKNLLRQLSNGEWLMSMPGTDEQKQSFIGCTTCHTLERIVRSQHDAAEWVQVWLRMSNYSQGSTPTRPQLRPSAGRGAGGGDMEAAPANLLKSAAYAATINLASSSTFPYELKTLPRPK